MIYVKVKVKGIRFIIPVPYVVLNSAISIVTSKFLQEKLNKWTKEYFEKKKVDFTFPLIDKKMLKLIIKELKGCKGIVLVDIKAKDGTEVKVRL
ncbi:MAG: hypothetical protein RR587_02825 [Solibacillus sp.]